MQPQTSTPTDVAENQGLCVYPCNSIPIEGYNQFIWRGKKIERAQKINGRFFFA